MQKIVNKILAIVMLAVIVCTLIILKINIDAKNIETAKQLGATKLSIEENKILQKNTKETPAGTEVELPLEWYKAEKVDETIEKQVKVASVIAVATGDGETVPVPEGFYYVGGTKQSGVVISSDERDKNKYAGVENVPAGAVYNNDGTVKTYTDEEYKNLTDDEKKAVILGDQFVWIPVTAEEYTKTNWGDKYKNTTWETQTNTAELPQIQKYEGFYIGRYEAGTSEITLSTGVDFAKQSEGRLNDAFSIRDGLNHTATGKITTKAGEIPYYHADYYTAHKLSQSMYSTDYVQSGLVTGTMWDAMLKFIAGSDSNIVTTESTWGNYFNGNVNYTVGQGRYISVSSTVETTGDFKVSDGTNHEGIKTTAISEGTKQKNIYDVAGNLWEWTQEASYRGTNESNILRGGSFNNDYSKEPACSRHYDINSGSALGFGFRPALYIK